MKGYTKMLKKELSNCVILVMFFILVLTGCSKKTTSSSTVNNEKKKPTILMSVPQLHNGDAKFLDNQIITGVNGKLAIYDLDGNLRKSYEDINVNWVYTLPEERIVVYSNFNKEIGIVKLDEKGEVQSNEVVMKNENVHIDPTIVKVDGKYYMTATEIEGTINNDDKNKENGIYTIHLYKSTNLLNWEKVSDIIQCQNNLEDVDVFYQNGSLYVTYEKEELNKGNSAIYIIKSKDIEGKDWEKPKELLKSDCDHEFAVINKMPNGGYELYYSCDKDNLGESYMGANLYYAIYDKNFNLQKQDIQIPTVTKKGIRLYDVSVINKKLCFLFAKDYLTDCDLVVEGVDD